MIPIGSPGGNFQESNENKIDLIYEIIKHEYGSIPKLISTLISDVIDLYEGRWPTHEACMVRYHTLDHAVDVALLTARMASGWNRQKDLPTFSEETFLCGLAAAMFHDTGYIKDKGDKKGTGGKYTFTHEQRSMKLAAKYLAKHKWSAYAVDTVPRIISITEYHNEPDPKAIFETDPEENMAKIVATSDLVAQMADINYIQRINDLYAEINEAYEFDSTEILAKRGIHIFSSAQEMIDETIGFYDTFVLPRLQQFGRMDQYLVGFFGGGRNPYLESIAANLSGHLMDKRIQWRRLGEILEELGVVNSRQIKKALEKQKRIKDKEAQRKTSAFSLQGKLHDWMDSASHSGKCLGDILMEMGVIDPTILRKGILDQIMPPALINNLSCKELIFILRISILLQNISKGPWVFDQILEMTNILLDCEASSILLANDDASEMTVLIPTGPKRDYLLKKKIPTDKGLAGWVFRHGQPAVVTNVEIDKRFDDEVDRHIGFITRSVLAVPLHTNGEMIGVMEVVNKRNANFNVHDMDILTMLANVIAISLGGLVKMHEDIS
ncbi:MAG: GAF domain-containing protein [Proteobacteria bacterium]|nr:GAF domain-containing protein [Pseudomonadota bacterium]MBU1709287.1 GAF domain-containing protein [Pseudomonadota bacterium]